jgi:hypothetical protein
VQIAHDVHLATHGVGAFLDTHQSQTARAGPHRRDVESFPVIADRQLDVVAGAVESDVYAPGVAMGDTVPD